MNESGTLKSKTSKILLIFDNECPVCRFFAKFAKDDRIDTKPIQECGELLKKIMGDNFPFTLYLINEDEIYWGKDAAKHLLELRGLGPISYIAPIIYPLVSLLNSNYREFNKGKCRCIMHGRKKIAAKT